MRQLCRHGAVSFRKFTQFSPHGKRYAGIKLSEVCCGVRDYVGRGKERVRRRWLGGMVRVRVFNFD